MACLYNRNGIYYAKFYSGSKPKRVSLRTDSLQVAKAKIRKIENSLAMGNDSPLPTHTPLEQAITAYVDFMKATKTPKSALKDIRVLRQFFGYICPALETDSRRKTLKNQSRKKGHVSPLAAKYIEQITTADISSYFTSCVRARGISARTVNRLREVISRFYSWSIKQGGVRMPRDKNPVSDVERYRQNAPQIRFLTLQQIDEQLNALQDNPQIQTMVAMYVYAGLRREEDAFPPERKAPTIATPPKRKPSVSLPEFLEPVAAPEYTRLDKLNAGSEAAQELQMQWVEKEYPLEVMLKKTGIVLRLVPPGKFLMGSKSDSEAFEDEKPRHKVNITSPMYVAKFPVTQQQWQSVMGENPAKFQTGTVLVKRSFLLEQEKLKADTKEHPVEQVSWYDCQEFLNRVHDQLDMELGKAIRLLTEAQWEYACRAGTSKSRYGNLEAIAWCEDNSGHMTHPVGKKRPNAWGLHDMIGNVFEWCENMWHAGYKNAPTDGSAWEDGESARVLRGGCWFCDSRFCRSALRLMLSPVILSDDVGFRVVVDLPAGQAGLE